jgi:DNA-binding CsgD family transcriptional regulator
MARAELRIDQADEIDRSQPPGSVPRKDSEERRRLSDLMVAFDLALEVIKEPALLIGNDGEILRANAIALATLVSDMASLRRSLALALTCAAHGRATAEWRACAWDLTPLGRSRDVVGFLAILRGPPSEQALGEALAAARRRWKLTPRQVEVLELVARGLTNELIAETLGIGKGTVEFHLSALFDKAGVSNRATLIAQALR